MKAKTSCYCGMEISPCGLRNHLTGGSHYAAFNRTTALEGKEKTHDVACIYASDIAAVTACGYEVVSAAFFCPGSQNMPGRFHDGILFPVGDTWEGKIVAFRHARKIEMMRKYRQENREELLQQKKDSWPKIKKIRQAKKAITAMGLEGQDDRIRITSPFLIVQAENGLIICSEDFRIVQVVVKDTTTGLVHFLTIPPEFGVGLPEHITAYQAVHAAIAWTFGLQPNEYAPVIEA